MHRKNFVCALIALILVNSPVRAMKRKAEDELLRLATNDSAEIGASLWREETTRSSSGKLQYWRICVVPWPDGRQCTYKTSCKRSIQGHVLLPHDESIKCPEDDCDFLTVSELSMETHKGIHTKKINQLKAQEEHYQDTKCFEILVDGSAQAMKHKIDDELLMPKQRFRIESEQWQSYFTCPVSGCTFERQYENLFVDHIALHSNPNALQCLLCGFLAATEKGMKMHITKCQKRQSESPIVRKLSEFPELLLVKSSGEEELPVKSSNEDAKAQSSRVDLDPVYKTYFGTKRMGYQGFRYLQYLRKKDRVFVGQ